MKKHYTIKPNVIHIECGDEFAIMDRYAGEEGLRTITFSTPITARDADIINQSGIAQVVGYSRDGKLSFTRDRFFETYLMCDLIVDILEKNTEH